VRHRRNMPTTGEVDGGRCGGGATRRKMEWSDARESWRRKPYGRKGGDFSQPRTKCDVSQAGGEAGGLEGWSGWQWTRGA
jgi:hypothetical protein